ncbi:MAG TPA: polysaccharide deacetylase family protein [Micropepsaceae bacterium]|nr:polysaccharide deacetylase family protein [Micropepsaceae bacterium]
MTTERNVADGASGISRRAMIQTGSTIAAAGAAGLAATPIAAQTAADNPIRTGTPHPFYDYSSIVKRPKLKWPNGARVAVFIVPNVEHWDVKDDKGHMDVRNEPRNDYGLRVAIWRLFEIFQARNIRTTIALNASVCRFYPEIIAAFKQRGDELMGHGMTNSERMDTLSPAAAAEVVRAAVAEIRNSTGERVRGWLGPGLAEADGTLDALKSAGLEYVCDWGAADDQPFRMKNGLYAVPYTLDINDIGLIDRQGTPASQFAAYIIDAFDTLYREGEDQARVLPIALHPFLIGAPHRAPHLAKALDYIRGHDGVWFARGGEILDAYRAAIRT